MITRRNFLKGTGMMGAACLVAPLLSCTSHTDGGYDTIIRNGTVYDGTAAAPLVADVGIRGDRIVALGRLTGSSMKTIDGRNRIVTPGFIDVHDHTDYTFRSFGADRDLARGNQVWCSNRAALLQGVTTVISGNCGYGYSDMNDYYTFLDSLPFGSNTYYLTPHGYLRQDLFGENTKSLMPDQLNQLKKKLAEEMEKGAIGMSTGLAYVPGVNASKEELIELGKVLKSYNGIYVSHIRTDPPSDYNTAAAQNMEGILEAIDIGRQAGIPVQISHIKGYIGGAAADFESICQAIEDARQEGIDVTADQYPFAACSTLMNILVPADYRTATGIRQEYWNDAGKKIIRGVVAETFKSLPSTRILVTEWGSYQYKYLSEIAAAEGMAPEDLYAEMACNENCPSGLYFTIAEEAMEKLMAKEYVFTGSDGCAVPVQSMYGHPRATATFSKKLKVYALEKGVLSLQSAILSMTSRPAEKFGIKERGKIVPGYYADLCVIDPASLRAPATYNNPSLYSEGITHVIVNGVFEVENGSATGVCSGRTLRRS
ncbi:MAG: amidohydrolase family protein [Syntrophales bacterium]|nr:amidohydrolase family protein [Syntrophales bacterium]